ncbi:MAG: HPr kinase/phosphorylase [Paracoccaceae bacterium]
MTRRARETLHASSVAFCGKALLIIGPSGSGKSGLSLDLLSRGAELIADDQTVVTLRSDVIIASAPAAIKGQIEARGIGILAAGTTAPAPVALVVDLGKKEKCRLPENRTTPILGIEIDLIFGAETPSLAAAIIQFLKGGRVA